MPRNKNRRRRGRGGGPAGGAAAVPPADGDAQAVAVDPGQGVAAQDLVQDEPGAHQEQNYGDDHEPVAVPGLAVPADGEVFNGNQDQAVPAGGGADEVVADQGHVPEGPINHIPDLEELANYGPAPPADPEMVALSEALRKLEQFERIISVMKHDLRMAPQVSLADIPELIINAAMTGDVLNAFYRASEEEIFSVYPMTIPVELPDGTLRNVPVTPEKLPSVEDQTHHFVTIIRRIQDFIVFGKWVVEDHSGYAMAFKAYRVVIPPEGLTAAEEKAAAEAEETALPWCLFRKEDLPTRFGRTERLLYTSSYSNQLKKVTMHDAFGKKLLDFMMSFMPSAEKPEGNYSQRTTNAGNLLFDTFYVVCCEARRFTWLERWAKEERCRILPGYCDIFQDYLSLSTLCILLYVYIVEKDFAEELGELGGQMLQFAEESKQEAIDEWDIRQKVLCGSGLKFFDKKKEAVPELNRLAGSVLKLVKNEQVGWDKILNEQVSAFDFGSKIEMSC